MHGAQNRELSGHDFGKPECPHYSLAYLEFPEFLINGNAMKNRKDHQEGLPEDSDKYTALIQRYRFPTTAFETNKMFNRKNLTFLRTKCFCFIGNTYFV